MIISEKAKSEEKNNMDRKFTSEINSIVMGREQDIFVGIWEGKKALENYDMCLSFGMESHILNIAEVNLIISKLKKCRMKDANSLIEYGKVDSGGAFIGHPKRFWYSK